MCVCRRNISLDTCYMYHRLLRSTMKTCGSIFMWIWGIIVLIICLKGVYCTDVIRRQATNRCPPVCAIFCPHGNVLDDQGCPICQCKRKETVCPEGYMYADRKCCASTKRRCGRRAFCYLGNEGRKGLCCKPEIPSENPSSFCPDNRRFGICLFDEQHCLRDSQCEDHERCCPDGCGRICKHVDIRR